MASKQLTVDGIGDVTLYKRKGVRYVRISLDPRGGVRVTLPAWVPYKAGLSFLETKRQWVLDNVKVKQSLQQGQRIGKAHTLTFVHDTSIKRASTRVGTTTITVKLPLDLPVSSPEAQQLAERAALRALKKEAEKLLPERLKVLAQKHGFTYKSVKIKKLKSRWGSCNNHKEIVLNAYLIQLPWQLIDYVILHELTHTKVLAHGKPFWEEMDKHLSDVKGLRREMKRYQAHIMQQSPLFGTQGM